MLDAGHDAGRSCIIICTSLLVFIHHHRSFTPLCWCRVSEIRAVNLLEDLCEAMEDYTLVTPSSSSTADSNSTLAEQQPLQSTWVKYKGDGSVKVAKSER